MKTVEELKKELDKYGDGDLVQSYEGEAIGLNVFDSDTGEWKGFIDIGSLVSDEEIKRAVHSDRSVHY